MTERFTYEYNPDYKLFFVKDNEDHWFFPVKSKIQAETLVDKFKKLTSEKEELLEHISDLEDKIEELKICNRRLKGRAVAIPDVCTKDCQYARFETVGHGDMRWICALQSREKASDCHFGKLCSFLEGLDFKNIEEC